MNRVVLLRNIFEGVISYLLLITLAGAILHSLYEKDAEAEIARISQRERSLLEIVRERQESALQSAASDVRYLVASSPIHNWLATGSETARRDIEANFASLMSAKRIYDQIRILAPSGKEIVRVNWQTGKAETVPNGQLQVKATRPYFKETLRASDGMLVFSRFDLNVENGKIELPRKPTIRIGAPLLDKRGQTAGIIAVNLLGQRLIDTMLDLAPLTRGYQWLLDSDGYWLHGAGNNDWAFMYADRPNNSAAEAYADVWQRLVAKPSKGEFVQDGDLYTYVRIVPPTMEAQKAAPDVTAGRHWYLVSRLPTAVLGSIRQRIASEYMFLGLAAAISFGLTIAIVTLYRYQREQWHAASKAQQSELQFRSVIEAAPDAVVVCDAEGRIIFANEPVEALFGYKQGDLIGKPIEILIPAESRDRHQDYRAGYTKQPRVRQMGKGRDLLSVRSDGTHIPIEVSLGYTDANGQFLIIATIQDMREKIRRNELIQEIAEQLSRDNAQLRALNEELAAFSYSVSHDLRAPLRRIDGFSQALIEDHADQLDEIGREHAMRVRKAAQRMGMLIDDLLKLSRISRSALERKDVDLSKIVREIVDSIRESDPSRAVVFTIDDTDVADGDERFLRVALENLLHNAWKFTTGRTPARISFGQETLDGETVYCLSDNGVGFNMAYANKLFGAFQRLHNETEFPGTGIGLATVRRVISKHGGRIWAAAEPGKGATFRFTL